MPSSEKRPQNEQPSSPPGSTPPPPKTVKIARPDATSSPSSSSASSASLETPAVAWLVPVVDFFSAHFSWVSSNSSWSKLKPVIRCAVAAWISAVLFVIPAFEVAVGQASFLILIAAFLSPPSDPFMSVLERETLILLFVCTAWAWACLGIFLADLARRVHDPAASFLVVVSGQYIEAGPTVIMGVFVFFGSAFFLYMKARQGPGPYTFACVFACICLDISLTTAALFPYPFYLVGRGIAAPIACHSALALLTSLLVFPSTISALFTARLGAVTAPMLSALSLHRTLLAETIASPGFTATLAEMRKETKAVEGALIPLSAAARLLPSDLIYARFAPADFRGLQGMLRRLAGRADGLGVYWALVDPGRERFPGAATGTAVGTPAEVGSRVVSRTGSRAGSRTGSVERDERVEGDHRESGEDEGDKASTGDGSRPAVSRGTLARLRSTVYPSLHRSAHSVAQAHVALHHLEHAHSHSHSHSHSHAHHAHSRALHTALARARAAGRVRRAEHAVGIFESQRYLNLEMTRLHDPREEEYGESTVVLLRESCEPLLAASHAGLTAAQTWLGGVREGRLSALLARGRSLLGIGRDMKRKSDLDINGKTPKEGAEDTERERNTDEEREGNAEEEQEDTDTEKRYKERVAALRAVRAQVVGALEAFRRSERHAILAPYRPTFDATGHQRAYVQGYTPGASPPHSPFVRLPSPAPEAETAHAHGYFGMHTAHGSTPSVRGGDAQAQTETHDGGADGGATDGDEEYVMPPHRYLFYCYVYQYNLIQVTSIVVEMLDEILRLEKERSECRLWTPVQHAFPWNPWLIPENVEQIEDDEDPNMIQGIQGARAPPSPPSSPPDPEAHGSSQADLGLPRRRDPEALPPRNLLEAGARFLYRLAVGLSSGNAVFSLKAGVLTVLLCLPSFIKSSAAFAYENRFVWAIFMGQLTIARFRGETTFILTARITSTFFGGITGMVMWYISCGSGRGSAYGLAAVCFVCFPFFFFARLYWPIPPMSNIVFFVTAVLVIGYSYQDLHVLVPGAPGFGFTVFWKRFVLVTAGVVAAFIASFLPPSTTIRRYQRNLLATTMAEMGSIYCDILSFANTKHEAEIQDIVASLLAVRNKLGKSATLNTNIIYEFSLRGRWPAKRYQKIADLQMALSYSLSHLMSVLEHLEPSWSRAFLQRTRFMDPDFQGDILAVISMISLSLRTGTPLPQITPCPLIDRFTLKYHGLDVIHRDSEEDYGLPRTLSLDTLRDEQYLMFSVGISTAYGVINRLDKLMLAVKEVVGEQYHIHGVGLAPPVASAFDFGAGGSVRGTSLRGPVVELGERSSTVHFD